MKGLNKETIGGITLVVILVAGMFTFMPYNAMADLTALDKFGTIITIITNIQNIVTDIKTDLLLKKRFYQFVNDTSIEFEDTLIAKVKVKSCAPELQAANACAFNVESILIESAGKLDEDARIRGPDVDGIPGPYLASLPSPPPFGELGDSKVNFLIDACVRDFEGDCSFGPPVLVGASEEVGIRVQPTSPTFTIEKIEFNGQQPQGIELELVVEIEEDG